MKVLLLLLLLAPISFRPLQQLQPDRQEARSAFLLLNRIRQNPSAFRDSFSFSMEKIHPAVALVWNDTLAKVAEQKALDMARRGYFDHVDPDGYGMNYFISKAGYQLNPLWLGDKKYNFFESIFAGAVSGPDAIRRLIADQGVPNAGHRRHLLALDEWSASLRDIGIGFVRLPAGSPYLSYTCVLIAKHR